MKVQSRSLATRCNTTRQSILRFVIISFGIMSTKDKLIYLMLAPMSNLPIYSLSHLMKQDSRNWGMN
jgi:hypothetical protein